MNGWAGYADITTRHHHSIFIFAINIITWKHM